MLNRDVLEHTFACLRQMGASNDHPSPLDMKYRIRAYILGRDISLVGTGYNTDKQNCNINLTESSFCKTIITEIPVSDESLDKELCLSAMLFSVSNEEDPFLEGIESPQYFEVTDMNFEEVEKEGLAYFCGYIAKRFPQFPYLGIHIDPDDDTWIGHICRKKGRLMKPAGEFYEKAKLMEQLFKTFHGEKTLQEEIFFF